MILYFVHRVTGLEKTIMETEKIIGQKDTLIKDKCSEFTVVLAELIFDLDRLKDMYQAQKKKYEETIGRLENELNCFYVIVTSECIHLYFLSIVTQCLFQDVLMSCHAPLFLSGGSIM